MAIDRVGNSTYGFTAEAILIMHTSKVLGANLGQPLLPSHIAHTMVSHYPEAFGDPDLQELMKKAFLDWGKNENPDPIETHRLMEIAANEAAASNRQALTGLDLLYATIAKPVEPLSFLAGDQRTPLAYQEAIYVRAGGTLPRAHYGSPAHSIIDLSERFKVIPPALLETLHISEPPAFTPEKDIPRIAAGQMLKISGRRSGREIRQYVLA